MVCTIEGVVMDVTKVEKTDPQLYRIRMEQETDRGHFPVFVTSIKNTLKKGAKVSLKCDAYLYQKKDGKAYLNVREI